MGRAVKFEDMALLPNDERVGSSTVFYRSALMLGESIGYG
jgi:hypothetical protein